MPRASASARTTSAASSPAQKGPEAGVWVIAETTDLPTKFAKIVVTDDRGRYVMPDLPKANYSVWVRGYGLVDSPKVQTAPGKLLNLNAVVAPNAGRGGGILSADLLVLDAQDSGEERVPRHRAKGNGIAEAMKSQAEWLNSVKTNGCMSCHALGTKATRTMPEGLRALQDFDRSVGAAHRLRPGDDTT